MTGGFELGLERAGFGPVKWQVEIDDYATKVLEKHWPDVKRYRDIRDCGKHNMESVGLICGGFPCTPFSVAGKQKGKEDDRYLWPEMVRIITELRPSIVIGENVSGFIKMGLDTAISDLAGIGYESVTFSIPACAVDAPHLRQRVFVVGYSEKLHINDCGNKREKSTAQVSKSGDTGGQNDVADSDSTNDNIQGKNNTRNKSRYNKSFSGKKPRYDKWFPEPAVDRVVNGIPSRVDRLKCLGNSVVPQVSQAIGEILMEWIECQK